MKIINKHIALFSFPIILFSCVGRLSKKNWAEDLYGKQDTEVSLIRTSTDSLIKIDVRDDDLGKTIPLSEFISEFKYVPLKTTNKGLIGFIDKLIVKNNRIYILDQLQAKSIFTFDWNGNLLNVINKKGKGPGEYTSLKDFSVMDDGSVLAYDSGGRKLIKYNNEGNFVSEKKITFNFTYFSSNIVGGLIFSTNYSSQNYHLPQVHCHNLLISDSNLVIKKIALPYSEKNLLLRISNGPDFFENGDLQYYHPFLCDTIYQIEDQNVKARYIVDFEGKSYSRRNLEKKELYSTDDGFVYNREEMSTSKYLFHPFSFSDRVDYLSFANKMGHGLYSIYYDKKTNKAYIGDRYDLKGVKNVVAFNPPKAGYGNYLVGYVNASVFIKGWENYRRTGLKNVPDEMKDIYERVKATDNPVMFFAKTK